MTSSMHTEPRRRGTGISWGAVLAAVLLAAGCGAPLTNALFEEDILYLQALPSEDLYVDTPDGAGDTVSRPAPDAVEAVPAGVPVRGARGDTGSAGVSPALPEACVSKTDPCDPDLLRQLTVQMARNLNSYVYNLLVLLDKIRTLEPSVRTENSRTWGPIQVPGSAVFVRLEVTRGSSSFSYELTLALDPEDPAGDVVLAGFYRPGSTAADGAGQFWYSFSVHGDYFPEDVKMVGEMEVTYSTLGDEVYLEVALNDVGERSDNETVDASYAFNEPGDGAGYFFFSQPVEVHDPGEGETQLEEQASIWSSWHADGWGRADIRYYGGNLGEVVASGIECWDPAQSPVYAFMPGCPYDVSLWEPELCIESAVGWNQEVTSEQVR